MNTEEIQKRIIYVSPYYDPNVASGANRRFNEICERFLREFGDNFTLIVARGRAPKWWNGKNLIEVDYEFNHISKFRAMSEIGKALDALPPSMVVIESVPIPYRSLKRHVQFQVAYDFRYFTGQSKGFFYRLAFSQYLKSQWARAQFFVTPTDFSIAELEKYVGYDKNRVVKSYFGIDERLLAETPAGNTEKTIDILYVGHFEKRKNHSPLLRAIAKIDKKLRVMLIGVDNGMQKELEALAKELGLENVTFRTLNNDKELWNIYRQSRIFAYPSVYEGFGIPLIEALALGIPTVVADVPVFHEVGADLVDFFDPYSPDDIAEKLKARLTDGKTPPYEKVRAHLLKFTWDEIYRVFVKDLKEFTARVAKE